MSFFRGLAVRAGLIEHRQHRRLPADELAASYSADSKQKGAWLKDLSPGGAYLFTRDRWTPGTSFDLTLKRRSSANSPLSVRLRVKVVRLGTDGVGLIIEPEHIVADVWVNLVLRSAKLTAEFDLLRVLRASRALAFLRRFSPAAETSVMEHIAGESMYESGEWAVDTLLRAEELVESWKFPIRSGLNPKLVLSILENASRTNSNWVRQHWTGLLASSVQYWARDSESFEYIALLSRLDPVQIRILDTACSVALRAERDAGCALRELSCSKEMMRTVTGVADLFAVEQHLDYLNYLGLLEATVKRNLFEAIDEANLTPTRVGLSLYARCKGLLHPPEMPRRQQQKLAIPSQAGVETPERRAGGKQNVRAISLAGAISQV
jgi:hypothetical protein